MWSFTLIFLLSLRQDEKLDGKENRSENYPNKHLYQRARKDPPEAHTGHRNTRGKEGRQSVSPLKLTDERQKTKGEIVY